MLDSRCVLVWLFKGAGCIREKRGKMKMFESLRKWIQWNRIKWNDGTKIEFEKFTKSKKYSRKNKENIFNKNWN